MKSPSIGRTWLWLIVTAMAWTVGCGWTPSSMEHEENQDAAVEAVPENPHWQEAFGEPPALELLSPETQSLIHIVKWKRESLYSISRWYTGSGNNWKRLAAANLDINGHRIHIGDKILIPEALLIRRSPLPADFLKPVPVRRSTTPAENSKFLSPKKSGIPLYGTIESGAPPKTSEEGDLPVLLETID